MAKQPWAKAGVEPPLQEVLADPIVASLMKADRITRRDIQAAMAREPRPVMQELEALGIPA